MSGKADTWPTPLEMLDLMDAVDADKKKVTLSGREFTIEHRHGKVLVKPINGYVPMGYFEEYDFNLYRRKS